MFRILILDDDLPFAETLARSLERNPDLPCQVVSVDSAEAAYAAVHAAGLPFDAFLIDQRLGPGPDGITVLQELLQLSPRSGAVVFTVANDLEAGERAYKAGAFRYLHKPFKTKELVWVLRSLLEWHRTRYERDHLRVLTQIAETSQHATTRYELGASIVQGACELGFERARLWLYGDELAELVGLSAAGANGELAFTSLRFRVVDSPYASRALNTRLPLVFNGLEHGDSYLHQHYAGQGFLTATGDWVCLPLWFGDCLGMLALDNHSRAIGILPEQHQVIQLLGQQAAGALYRMRLREQEQRTSRELEVLAEIGRLVASRAATVDLDTLLREVRGLVGRLMDVRNFMLVLRDALLDELEFRLHIEHDQVQRHVYRPASEGLIGYVVRTGTPQLLPQRSSASFRRQHKIPRRGRRSQCWLGVPLRLEGETIGAIAVQSYDNPSAYDAEHQRLLTAVADQVAGAIQTARLRAEAEQNQRRLQALQQASGELLTLAEQKLAWLWHTTLTVITAGYGLGFNRAMLLLLNADGATLQGHMGIGQNSLDRALHERMTDLNQPLTFAAYLRQLRAGGFAATEVDTLLHEIVLTLPDDRSVFAAALRDQQMLLVHEQEAASALPQRFFDHFGAAEYAVLPLLVRDRPLGLVVVDAVHTRRPLRLMPLSSLETLLTQAALVFENQRQRQASDLLIEAQTQVLAEVATQPLRETLSKICSAAQVVSRADAVLIYPFRARSLPDDLFYDLANTVQLGLLEPFQLRERPSDDGVTRLALRAGPLVVPDRTRPPWSEQATLANSRFLGRERVVAFLGVPIHSAEAVPVGMLYLNYRTAQHFDDADLQRAQSFADLVAAAIHTARLEEATRSGREAAELMSTMRGRELRTLSRVLSTALKPVTRNELVRVLLLSARDLLKRGSEQFGLILREWQPAANLADEPREVRRQYFLRADDTLTEQQSMPELYTGITGHAFSTNKDALVPDVLADEWRAIYRPRQVGGRTTRSEMDVLIRQDRDVLGLFNVESPQVGGFSGDDYQVLRRLATVAALPLDSVRRQEKLDNILAAVQAVVAPVDLLPTLHAVLEAARQVAPGVSAVTIWYRDPETEKIVPGPRFGVRHEQEMFQDFQGEDNVLHRVMWSHQPIFAEQVHLEPRLVKRFVANEQIQSVAAFPLWANGTNEENEAIGAMFFNYRQPHTFTAEERTLFPILAAVAATSVRDALRLEQVRRERSRLQTALAVANAVGTTLSLDETLEQVMRTLRSLFGDAWPCVLTYHVRTRSLEFAPASMEFYPIKHRDRVASLDIYHDKSIACRVARKALASGQRVLENYGDARSDSDYLEVISETRSELCLALLDTDKRLLGVLVLESAKANAFNSADLALIEGIGPAISTAIARANDINELQFSSSVASATVWAAELAHYTKREIGIIRKLVYVIQPKVAPAFRPILDQIEGSASLLVSYAEAPQTTEELPLDDWIRQKLDAIATLPDFSAALCVELACPAVRVQASPVLLERALRHLVRNALEAMRDANVAAPQLTIRTLANSDSVEVQLANPGTAIDDTTRQHLFNREISTKGDDHNGGRGLLFVKWAVKAMRGSIDLISKPGEDVTFAFTLPIAPARTAPAEEGGGDPNGCKTL